MKILATQSATLTNHEVCSHLSFLSARPRSSPTSTFPANFTTVTKEVASYLSSASHPDTPLPASISKEQIEVLVKELREYGLTKAEVLMCVNLGPRELGLLDCVIEELDERLREEEQESVLKVVGRVMGERNGDAEMNAAGNEQSGE